MKYSVLVLISFLLAASMVDASERPVQVAGGLDSRVVENTEQVQVKPRMNTNSFYKKLEYRQFTDRSR